MTNKYKDGDRVVFTGEAVTLLDPATFSLSDVRLEAGTVGEVKKTSGPYYLVCFEGLKGSPTVPIVEGDLKKEGE